MLGASPPSVLLPFMVEMIILLCAALAIAMLLTVAFLWALPFFIPALADESPFKAFASAMRPLLAFNLPWIFVVEVCLLPAVAYVGTFLGAGKKMLSPKVFLSA